MATSSRSDWSDLPNDLLSIISNRLDRRVDLPRMRAVCKSWRSSIPFKLPTIHSFCIHIAQPYCKTFLTWGGLYRKDITVEESALYRFKYRGGEFVVSQDNESEPTDFFIVNPLYYHQGISNQIEKIPEELNLSDSRLSDFKKIYKINWGSDGCSKAAYSVENSTLLFATQWNILVFHRAGENKLTQVCDTFNFHHDDSDITFYNGNFYVIDQWGKIIVIDPLSMNITRNSSLPSKRSNKKQFVRSQNDLYVVDGHINDRRRLLYLGKPLKNANDFKIYKLNESDCTWVGGKRMRNQVVFVNDDCIYIASLA